MESKELIFKQFLVYRSCIPLVFDGLNSKTSKLKFTGLARSRKDLSDVIKICQGDEKYNDPPQEVRFAIYKWSEGLNDKDEDEIITFFVLTDDFKFNTDHIEVSTNIHPDNKRDVSKTLKPVKGQKVIVTVLYRNIEEQYLYS